MSTQNVTAVPTSIINSGSGLLWSNPGNASGTGLGSALGSVVQAFSIATNVVTFITTPQSLVSGQSLVIENLEFGSYLNGVTLTVLSSGLSSTGFSANFSHADVTLTYDAGTITPVTTYATATNFSYVSLSAGQHALNVAGQDGASGSGYHPAALGFLPSVAYAFTRVAAGVNGFPLGPPQATSTSAALTVPTLPAGSTVVGIYPYAIGTISGSLNAFTAAWTSGSGTFTLNGSPSVLSSIGTSLSILSTLTFTNHAGPATGEATAPGYSYSDSITDYGAVVVYTTTGTPIPSSQLQTLVGTNLGLSIPSSAVVAGVEVNLSAGTTIGSSTASLQAQLTVGGTPVGNIKTISSLSGWSAPYVLGGSSDPWGAALSGSAVSGASGLGINLSGTLPTGDQINLNSLTITVYYFIPAVVVSISIGNTRPPTVGFN